ncbi:hypothetical protein EYC80_007135 [Monilinia laxa]|uniref:Uncharacterized protein n=1 Tax=Monilinia laxa TaxID=61186 RepID=A0A5N6K0Q1_MONLA|nr:hypothetical protein EYC80_007135 [Monilinia laxa]
MSSLMEDGKQLVLSERIPECSTAFVFTGQGSEWACMGKQLYEASSFCRTIFHQHDAICVGLGFSSFIVLLIGDDMDLGIASPIQIQLAIVSFESTLSSLWQHWGVRPSVAIGHSLGEYPALVSSGILSLSDMFFLVGLRAQIIQDSCSESTHSMLAVKVSAQHAEEILRQNQSLDWNVACINSPSSTVISGYKDDVANLRKFLDLQNIKSTVLGVRYAFHSPQMDPVLGKYRQMIKAVRFTKATIPFASAYQSDIIMPGHSISPEYLVQQTRQPVKFQPALQVLKTKAQIDDSTMWLDLGPRPLCLNMIQQSLNIPPSRLIASYKGGMDIQWRQYHGQYGSNLNLLELPSYAFDVKNYWIQYEGNWSLTKGRDTTQTQTPTSDSFKTTTLQVIESENREGRQATVIFSSNLAEKHLRIAVRGHSVNGTLLCPSSVYGDMAIGAAAYVFSKTHPNEKIFSFDVYNMEVIKPLLANDDGKDQWIQITATKQEDDEFVSISISSHESETLLNHISCVVKHGSGVDWMCKWARNTYFVKARIENLMEGIAQRSTQQILRPIAYKLFSDLVTYHKRYQGMKRVYLNSDLYEAAAEIEFQSAYSDGTFHVSPYCIDSILHISGFILNGSEMTSKDTVYISHGWRSLRIARPLSHTKRYRNYVRMQPTDTRGVMAGDIYVFDGDEIIAVCKGLKFQEIKRKVLGLLLERQSNSLAAMQGALKLPTRKITANLPIAKERRSNFGEILKIIASEAEIGVDELTDNACLVELGIDSLLAMGIVERIRVLLKCADIPSSIFFDFQTVSQLRTFFSNNVGSYESSERETTTHSDKSGSKYPRVRLGPQHASQGSV